MSHQCSVNSAMRIAELFSVTDPVTVSEYPEKGNINRDTFLVVTGSRQNRRECLLQRINPMVFPQPRRVVIAMAACIEAQRRGLERHALRGDEEWEVISLVPTRTGDICLEVDEGDNSGCWRMMAKIPEARSFKRLGEIVDYDERLRIAQEAASGLARFSSLTRDIEVSSLATSLPGYRDTRIYYNQLYSVLENSRSLEAAGKYLPEDPTTLQATARHFLVQISEHEFRRRIEDPDLAKYIELVRVEEKYAMTLLEGMITGQIRKVAIHGDPKLENFLFSTRSGRVKALVDLDTVMPHTWLADWGDMVRSMVNIAGEREKDLSKVYVDTAIYQAAAQGYLTLAPNLTSAEIRFMPNAVEIMALELGVRFLADYIRGDTYFVPAREDPQDLNKIRALVQLTLFERLREKKAELGSYIEKITVRDC